MEPDDSNLADYLEGLAGESALVDRGEYKEFLYHLTAERTARDGATGLATITTNPYVSAMNA